MESTRYSTIHPDCRSQEQLVNPAAKATNQLCANRTTRNVPQTLELLSESLELSFGEGGEAGQPQVSVVLDNGTGGGITRAPESSKTQARWMGTTHNITGRRSPTVWVQILWLE